MYGARTVKSEIKERKKNGIENKACIKKVNTGLRCKKMYWH